MKGTIYCVHCISTGKKYIGQTIQKLQYRINDHFCRSSNSQYKFHRAIKKYGINNFTYGVIEECDFDLINEREMYWIKIYDTFRNGYNSDTGGMNGRLLSEETKSKIQKKTSKQNNPRYGAKLDNDLKERIRESNAVYEYCIVELENNITYKTKSLRDFCERYDLKRANLTRTFTGRYKQHKGFKMISKVPLLLVAHNTPQTPANAL